MIDITQDPIFVKKWQNIFIVVLYEKNILESQTIQSILRNASVLNAQDLVIIWNNGPQKIEAKKIANQSFKLFNNLENTCLSKVYNQVSNLNFHNLIIMDDDSVLSCEYLTAVRSYSADAIGLPKVIVNEKLEYPKEFVNFKRLKKSGDFAFPISISSGLVLPKKLLDIVAKKFDKIFDERFCFYGVDTSFFYRLNQINQLSSVCILPDLYHNLSKFSPESNSEWRRTMRTNDFALQLKYYYKLSWIFPMLLKVFFSEMLSRLKHGHYCRYYPFMLIKSVLSCQKK